MPVTRRSNKRNAVSAAAVEASSLAEESAAKRTRTAEVEESKTSDEQRNENASDPAAEETSDCGTPSSDNGGGDDPDPATPNPPNASDQTNNDSTDKPTSDEVDAKARLADTSDMEEGGRLDENTSDPVMTPGNVKFEPEAMNSDCPSRTPSSQQSDPPGDNPRSTDHDTKEEKAASDSVENPTATPNPAAATVASSNANLCDANHRENEQHVPSAEPEHPVKAAADSTGEPTSVTPIANPTHQASAGMSSTIPAGVPGFSPATSPSQPLAGVDPSLAATVTNPESIVEESAELPAIYVGKVLGKGGDMIRDLQARSSCRIDVDQNVPPGSPRIITYRGTRSAVDFAKYLVQLLCAEQTTEADLPLGNATQKALVIPASSIGKVIGRGGEMVRSMQSRSQARIQIDHSGAGLDPTQRKVVLTGANESIVKAEEMIMFLVANPLMDAAAAIDMLVQDKMRGGVWGSGPPYPNMPNQGQGMSGYAFDQGSSSYGAAPMGTYPPQVPHFAGSWAPPVSGAGVTEADIFPAAKMYMGRIIGSKGITVNDLQTRSGCDIQINQDVPPGQDCQITIRGSREGIEMAKQMIRGIIESGPNHPYAGGGQPGGYGGYQGAQQQAYGYQAPQTGYNQQVYPHQSQHYQAEYQGYQPAPTYGGHGQVGGHMQMPMSAWKSARSADGQVYYYNEQTGQTQWEKPVGLP